MKSNYLVILRKNIYKNFNLLYLKLVYEYLVKYYVKKQDNTFLSVPGNNYPVGGISSPNLNERTS